MIVVELLIYTHVNNDCAPGIAGSSNICCGWSEHKWSWRNHGPLWCIKITQILPIVEMTVWIAQYLSSEGSGLDQCGVLQNIWYTWSEIFNFISRSLLMPLHFTSMLIFSEIGTSQAGKKVFYTNCTFTVLPYIYRRKKTWKTHPFIFKASSIFTLRVMVRYVLMQRHRIWFRLGLIKKVNIK